MRPIVDELRDLVEALTADLGSLGPLPRVAVFQRRPSESWIFDTGVNVARPDVADFDASSNLITVVGGHTFAVDGSSGPELLIEIASHVQDVVVDSTGKSWPDVYRGSKFLGVARPVLSANGVASWAVPGSPEIPSGAVGNEPSVGVS